MIKEQLRAPSIAGPARGEVYRGGSWHNLPPHSEADSINDGSDVAGLQYSDGAATIWPHKGAAIAVSIPAGGQDGAVMSINDFRGVVGYCHVGDVVDCQVWTPNQGASDLGWGGSGDCPAYAINDVGQITGQGGTDAFLLSAGEFMDLDRLHNAVSRTGLAINLKGTVVGATDLGTSQAHAFMWNGSLVDAPGVAI